MDEAVDYCLSTYMTAYGILKNGNKCVQIAISRKCPEWERSRSL